MNKYLKFLALFIAFFLSLFFAVLFLELTFGSWLSDNNWMMADRLNIIRNKKIFFDVKNLYLDKDSSIQYTRDKYGLRGGCKNPDEIDILTIGGSTTDQRFIADGKTWQDNLQNLIGNGICVSNAGVDGHSTHGHIMTFKYWLPLIPKLKPDYFILYIGINDAGLRFKPAYGFDQKIVKPKNKFNDVLERYKFKSAFYNLYLNTKSLFASFKKKPAYAGHNPKKPKDEDYTASSTSPIISPLIQKNTLYFADRLKTIIKSIKKYDAKVICVSQPHLFVRNHKGLENVFEYEGTYFNGLDYSQSLDAINHEMEIICKANDGYYIDIKSNDFTINDFYDAVHMTPSGTYKLSIYIYRKLVALGLVKN